MRMSAPVRMHANITARPLDRNDQTVRAEYISLNFKDGEISVEHCSQSVRDDIEAILPVLIELTEKHDILGKYVSIELPSSRFAYQIDQIIEHAPQGGYSGFVYRKP